MIDNEAYLQQEREGYQASIDENSEELMIERKLMIDNGFGKFVDDPYGIPESIPIIGRVSHISRNTLKPESVPAGLDSNMSRFLQTDYNNKIYDNDIIINYLGLRWKIMIADPVLAFNDVVGYQAIIIKAANTRGGT